MTSLWRRLLSSAASPRRPRPAPAFAPGAFYTERTGPGTCELARIIDSATDGLGVTHVRFELIYRYRDKTLSAGERTLARDAFERRFPRLLAEDERPG